MKNLALLTICLLVISCTDYPKEKQKLQKDIEKLEVQKQELTGDVTKLLENRTTLLIANGDLQVKVKVNEALATGRKLRYILKLRLKQSHVTLDLFEHAKDEMNAIEFELPVDKEFYESIEKGKNIVDKFRTGSFLLNSSLGSWKMKVIDKRIEIENL